jgi:hypothetical protein
LARSAKVSILGALLALAIGLCVLVAMAFLRSNPSTVDFASSQPAGQPVNLELQTVGTIGYGVHPSWVSYLVRDPQGKWIHTTLWKLPAHTRINVTIYQYDSGSPLRNQEFGQVQGTAGDVMTLNGRSLSVINSNAGNGVAHTFSVPSLGINVPLYGNNATLNLCGKAPCTATSPHNVITFSFMTPGPGNYPWQCFIPCGLGFLYGNSGPMQTIGYMDGFLEVVA